MIRRVYEQAQKAVQLADVIVATDDERICDEVRSFGGNVLMTSANHQNGTERCAEVLDLMRSDAEVIINIQGDEPFIHPQQIDTLAALFENKSCSIGTLIRRCDDMALLERPSIIKATVDIHFKALYFSRSLIPFQRNDNGITPFYKHIGIYGYRADILRELVKLKPSPLELCESLEQLRWLENGYNVHTALTDHESISVDVPEDVERIKDFL